MKGSQPCIWPQGTGIPVKILFDNGADISLKNDSGKTAAEVAANDKIRDLINRIKKL